MDHPEKSRQSVTLIIGSATKAIQLPRERHKCGTCTTCDTLVLSDSWICLDTPPVHIVRAHRFEYPIPYYAPAQRDYLDILSSPTSLDYVC